MTACWPGARAFDVLPEEGHRSVLSARLAELEAGLGLGLARHDDEDAAVDRLGLDAGGKGKLEAQARRLVGGPERGSEQGARRDEDVYPY